MDRRNWPWRKKISRNSSFTMSSDAQNRSFLPCNSSSPSVEPCIDVDKGTASLVGTGFFQQALPIMPGAENQMRLEMHRRHRSLLENAEAFEVLAMKDKAELQTETLSQKLEDAEKNLLSKEAMVKQHAKVAEEAISGWEKSEAQALSLKQELAVAVQQKSALEGQVAELEGNLKSAAMRTAELEEALKASLKQMRQAQKDHQQEMQEAIHRKTQEWGKERGGMENFERHLRQCVLAAEARSSAMAKSLEERSKAVTESQEAKARAEMEAGLIQVKLESQASEMAAVQYELHLLTKELDIRNHENEQGRKALDAANRQHLEDVKKITKLEADCQRLRNLVRKKISGPAAIAYLKLESSKSEQSRRRSAGSSSLLISGGSMKSSPDLQEKLRAVKEEANVLGETPAKTSTELDPTVILGTTAKKPSVTEEQHCLHNTPKNTKCKQKGCFESIVACSQAIAEANDSERLCLSCTESWASALISELAQFKKPNRSTDIIAGKDAQLQSANQMCKNAIPMLAAAEAKLGGTWMSENPRLNVDKSLNHVCEAHGIMSKLDKILDDICIAAASVGDATGDDQSENGVLLTPYASAKGGDAAVFNNLNSLKQQIEKQAETIDELRMQMSELEITQRELQLQLHGKEEELEQVRSELLDASRQIEELKVSEHNLQCQQQKILAEEEAKRGEMQAKLVAKQNEVAELQNNANFLGAKLFDLSKKHDEEVSKCKKLEKRLQSYVDTDHNLATSKLDEDLASRAHKEREFVRAKEKLAECQQTISRLGKEFSAFMSPSSASFDSTMSLQYGVLDTNCHQDSGHALKMHAHSYQERPSAKNLVTAHGVDDGIEYTTTQPNTCTFNLETVQPLENRMLYSMPRRINSDLSYRTGSKHPVSGIFSVADHLQMDDGFSSLYDSRTESAASSPSSQHTSPGEIVRMHRNRYEHRRGSGIRSSLGRSLENAGAPTTGDSNGHMNERKSQLCMAGGTRKGSGNSNKSLSRFFGRSKN